jgi:TDG/mug DNA glycosylase family protein
VSHTKPTKGDLLNAINNQVPDIIAPNLKLLLVGINPGLYSAWSGHHFAHPGNRFWPALFAGGITPTLLRPDQNSELLSLGIGITNMVSRTTARADELTKQELIEGGHSLTQRVAEYHPRWVAILGVTAFRVAFNQPKAQVGGQDMLLHTAKVWLLTNPSGLNAHYTPARLAEVFSDLARAIA